MHLQVLPALFSFKRCDARHAYFYCFTVGAMMQNWLIFLEFEEQHLFLVFDAVVQELCIFYCLGAVTQDVLDVCDSRLPIFLIRIIGAGVSLFKILI